MDDIDYETIVSEKLGATQAKNLEDIMSDNIGLNTKPKVEGSAIKIIGIGAMHAMLNATTFHGTKAKPTKENAPPKETYEERISKLLDGET